MTAYTATLTPTTATTDPRRRTVPLRTLTVTSDGTTWLAYLSPDSAEKCSEVTLPALDWLPYGDWRKGDNGTLTINVTKTDNQ